MAAEKEAEDERLSSRPRGGGMGFVSFGLLVTDDDKTAGSAVVSATPSAIADDPASAAAAAPRRSPALGFAIGFLGGMFPVCAIADVRNCDDD